MKTIDLSPRIGSEILTDVNTLLSGELSGEIRSLLEQRGVIAIRELNFTDEQQVAFTATLEPSSKRVTAALPRSRWIPRKMTRQAT